jgi:phosphoribosylformylglycinamidine synthase
MVLGICNGFQIACEAGLLPGVLMRNAQMRFICHLQHLRVERNDTPYTSAYREGEVIEVCVAHGEGNWVADSQTLARVEGDGLVALRYCDAGGALVDSPNGSINAIAGIYSPNRRVLGLMPHPENLVEPLTGGTDGLGLFKSLAAAETLLEQA